MDREVLNVFLINYSIIITFQILLKIWENMKLKEENELLKDNIRVEKESKIFYLGIKVNSAMENAATAKKIAEELKKCFIYRGD